GGAQGLGGVRGAVLRRRAALGGRHRLAGEPPACARLEAGAEGEGQDQGPVARPPPRHAGATAWAPTTPAGGDAPRRSRRRAAPDPTRGSPRWPARAPATPTPPPGSPLRSTTTR